MWVARAEARATRPLTIKSGPIFIERKQYQRETKNMTVTLGELSDEFCIICGKGTRIVTGRLMHIEHDASHAPVNVLLPGTNQQSINRPGCHLDRVRPSTETRPSGVKGGQ